MTPRLVAKLGKNDMAWQSDGEDFEKHTTSKKSLFFLFSCLKWTIFVAKYSKN